MLSYDLLLAFVLNVVMALVYWRVGVVVRARDVSADAQFARDSFAWWWYLLAIITATGTISTLLSALREWTLATFVTYTQVVLMAIIVALAAVLYYFAYLLTGRRSIWRPIAAAYAAYAVAILYFIQKAQPIGLEYGRFGTNLEYANDLSATPFALTLGVLLVLPVLLGAMGYFSLYFKVDDRSQRFRIATLAGAFIFWFGSSLLASYVFELTERSWWRVASTLIALVASYAVYISYRPPAWLQRRFNLRGYAEGSEAEAK